MSKIFLGKTTSGKPISFDLDLLLRTRLLVQANSGGGKSYLLRKLAEELFGKVQVFLIDRDGEFATLRERYGYLLVGQGGDTACDVRSARALAEKLLELRASAVFDLYEAFRSKPGDRRAWVRNFLEGVMDAPKRFWRPLVVIVDEAHLFAPESLPKAASMIERETISGCKDAMISLATAGRKRGFCAVWATQRLAKLDKDATAELLNRLVGMTIEDVDVDRAIDLMSVSKDEKPEFKKALKTMEPGNFFAFGRAVATERVLVRVGKVLTTHPEPGSAKHAEEPPPAPEEIRHLLPKLSDFPKEAAEKAKTETELRAEVRALKAELAKVNARKPEPIRAKSVPAARPAKPSAPVRVEVPVVKPSELVRLERALEKAVQAAGRCQDAAGHLRGFSDKLAGQVSAVEKRARRLSLQRPSELPMRTVRSRMVTSLPAPAKPLAARASEPGNGEIEEGTELPPRRRRILNALAEMEALGRSQIPKPCAAAMAGVSPNAGSYKNDCGALRAAAYVTYPMPGTISLTDAGRALAEPSEPPSNDEELLERCLKILPPRRKAILKAIHEAFPQALTREEIAEQVGVSAAAGSFKNDLGAMRSMEFLEYPMPNTAKAAAWMFLEEAGVA